MSYGLVDDKGLFNIIDAVRKGLKFAVFALISKKSPFNISEWASFLHLSERTMQRYEKENKTFEGIYAEKIIQISMLYNYGVEIFGNKEKFDSWLIHPNVALGGQVPKQLLDSSFGIELLKDELGRIEHGVLA